MNGYRAYIIGSDGHILQRVDFPFCKTDEDAKNEAAKLADGHDVELWDLSRKICDYKAISSGEG